MRKVKVWALIMIFLLSFSSSAWAKENPREVTTFGFDDERTRVTEGPEPVLWPAWKDESGTSYSQPLILKGWGQFEGKTLVVAVTGNQLRGYVCIDPNGKPDESGFQQNDPLWSVQLKGTTETKSHPTLVNKDGKKYIYIGTDKDADTKAGHIQIIDITNFNQGVEVYKFWDQWSSDIVSAPLVLTWKGPERDHEIVVYTAGNTAEVHLATDPMEGDKISNNIQIKVASSGRTSSTPAPVFNGQGFVVGLDRGPSATSEFQIYRLNDILTEVNGKVELKDPDPAPTIKMPTHSSIVASFSVSGEWIYFGDQWSRVYGYNVASGEYWFNEDNKGIFSNRSPAITGNTVFFPAVGYEGEKGKLLSVDRKGHHTNWTTSFDSRAQTAPMVWMVPGFGAVVLEGTSQGFLASIDPNNGEKKAAIPVLTSSGTGSSYGKGISGELSGAQSWVVGTTEKGVVAWYAQPMDLEVVSLDTGCPKVGENYVAEPCL